MHDKIINTTLRSYVLITFLFVPCTLYSMNKKSDIQPLKESERRVLELLVRPPKETTATLHFNLNDTYHLAKADSIRAFHGTSQTLFFRYGTDSYACLKKGAQNPLPLVSLPINERTFIRWNQSGTLCACINQTTSSVCICDVKTESISESYNVGNPIFDACFIRNDKLLLFGGDVKQTKQITPTITLVEGDRESRSFGEWYIDYDYVAGGPRRKINCYNLHTNATQSFSPGLINVVETDGHTVYVQHTNGNNNYAISSIGEWSPFLKCILTQAAYSADKKYTNIFHELLPELRHHILQKLYTLYGGFLAIKKEQFKLKGSVKAHKHFFLQHNTTYCHVDFEDYVITGNSPKHFYVLDKQGRNLYGISLSRQDGIYPSADSKSILIKQNKGGGFKQHMLIDENSDTHYEWYTQKATPEQKKLLQKIASPQPHAHAFTSNDKNIYATLPASVQERFNHFIKK